MDYAQTKEETKEAKLVAKNHDVIIFSLWSSKGILYNHLQYYINAWFAILKCILYNHLQYLNGWFAILKCSDSHSR